MNQQALYLLAGAAAFFWWQRQKTAVDQAQATHVQASTNVDARDTSTDSILDTLTALQKTSTNDIALSFFGRGIDLTYSQTPSSPLAYNTSSGRYGYQAGTPVGQRDPLGGYGYWLREDGVPVPWEQSSYRPQPGSMWADLWDAWMATHGATP